MAIRSTSLVESFCKTRVYAARARRISPDFLVSVGCHRVKFLAASTAAACLRSQFGSLIRTDIAAASDFKAE